MIYVLTAKSSYNQEHHYEVYRTFPDVGPVRKFCGNKLSIRNLNSDQLKRLLAGDHTQLGRWHTQVYYDKIDMPQDQEKVFVLKCINLKNNRVHMKVWPNMPTWQECIKFDKHQRLKGVMFNMDNYIELGLKKTVEADNMLFTVEEMMIL